MQDEGKYRRSEKSLSTLTVKFCEMLKEENHLDLNAVRENMISFI